MIWTVLVDSGGKIWLIYCQKIENHHCQEGSSPKRIHLTHLQNKWFSLVRWKWSQWHGNFWSPVVASLASIPDPFCGIIAQLANQPQAGNSPLPRAQLQGSKAHSSLVSTPLFSHRLENHGDSQRKSPLKSISATVVFFSGSSGLTLSYSITLFSPRFS